VPAKHWLHVAEPSKQKYSYETRLQKNTPIHTNLVKLAQAALSPQKLCQNRPPTGSRIFVTGSMTNVLVEIVLTNIIYVPMQAIL
jgi:hypothetical protein